MQSIALVWAIFSLYVTSLTFPIASATGPDFKGLPDGTGSTSGSSSSLVLARILQDSKQISELIRLLQTYNSRPRSGNQDEVLREDNKREAAWDMDYGWGGGRFGKRMDSLGIAGRFGRSVDRSKSKLNV